MSIIYFHCFPGVLLHSEYFGQLYGLLLLSPVINFHETMPSLPLLCLSLLLHLNASLPFLPALKMLVTFIALLITLISLNNYTNLIVSLSLSILAHMLFTRVLTKSQGSFLLNHMLQLRFTLTSQWFVDLSPPVLSSAHWGHFLFCLCEMLSYSSSEPCVREIHCKLMIVPVFIWVAVMFSLHQGRVSGCISASHLQACVKCHFQHVL